MKQISFNSTPTFCSRSRVPPTETPLNRGHNALCKSPTYVRAQNLFDRLLDIAFILTLLSCRCPGHSAVDRWCLGSAGYREQTLWPRHSQTYGSSPLARRSWKHEVSIRKVSEMVPCINLTLRLPSFFITWQDEIWGVPGCLGEFGSAGQ